MVIKRRFKGWNRSTVVCRTLVGKQDKLYEVPLRGKKGESVQHITRECEKLAQNNTKEVTTMLQRKFIRIFVKRMG